MKTEWHRENIKVSLKALDYLDRLPEPNEDRVLEVTNEQRRDLVIIYQGLFQSIKAMEEKYKDRYIGTNHNFHFIQRKD